MKEKLIKYTLYGYKVPKDVVIESRDDKILTDDSLIFIYEKSTCCDSPQLILNDAIIAIEDEGLNCNRLSEKLGEGNKLVVIIKKSTNDIYYVTQDVMGGMMSWVIKEEK